MLEKGTRIGRWIVEHPLDEGLSSVVYCVHDVNDPRLAYALKLRKTGSPIRPKAFARECDLMRKNLLPAHLPPLVDSGMFQGEPYLVLPEYQSVGRNHSARKSAKLTLSLIEILKELLVRYDYRLSDLKPKNVMIGEDGELRLIDLTEMRTREQYDAARHDPQIKIAGTPGYLRESARRAKTVTEADEVFAVGTFLESIASLVARKVYSDVFRRVRSKDADAITTFGALSAAIRQARDDHRLFWRRILIAAVVTLLVGGVLLVAELARSSLIVDDWKEEREAALIDANELTGEQAGELAVKAMHGKGVNQNLNLVADLAKIADTKGNAISGRIVLKHNKYVHFTPLNLCPLKPES